jgi:hypothetical protein
MAAVAAMAWGCGGKPNAANIELRRQNQALHEQIASLSVQRKQDQLTIQQLESSMPTVPILPAERMNELYTVADLQLGRLTGWADLDPKTEGDDGLKIYVVPVDASGDELKAAGSFKIEAFDLSARETRVGEWSFSVDRARAHWNGSGLLYEYVLPCPFKEVLSQTELTLKVTFTDALTQRVYTVQKLIKKTR